MKKYNVIDLFSGCGGLSEGFLQTNKFKFLAHIEWEKPMVETLRNNLIKRWNYSSKESLERVVYFDIQKTDELINGNWGKKSIIKYGSYNSEILINKGLNGIICGQKVDVIIGGPPCQAYSLAGRAQDPESMKNDYRNYLFESFVKVVDYYKPEVFVFENVPGMLSAKPGDELVVNRVYKAFQEIGYEIKKPTELKSAIYSSVDFQVPQDRRRLVIFGVRQNSDLSLNKFYNELNDLKSNAPYKTVFDAIGDLPKFKPLKESYKKGNRNISHKLIGNKFILNHDSRYHNKRDIEAFKKWIKYDMNYFSNDKKIEFYRKVTGKNTNHNKYRNLIWNKPSPTIVSHLYKDGLMFIHPDLFQSRSITVYEAALLQTFPEDFEFIGSSAYCYKMIGNAVPVKFANNISKAIINVFENKNIIKNTIVDNKNLKIKNKRSLNVLIACEESQTVCSEFRRLGHNAYSCDLLKCSGGHPEWHFNSDVLEVIKNKGGRLQNGETVQITGDWDLMIAHPPCTYLAVSGARWYYHPDDKELPIEKRRPHPKFPNRIKDKEEGIKFFLSLTKAKIKYIAIENPIGVMSKEYRKPDQIIQPYWFGDEASKSTCLWLQNLKPLKPTNMVGKGEYIQFGSGKRLPKWYSDAMTKSKSSEERRTMRSKTFLGFAKAMAEQWSKEIIEYENIC